ncbi:PREDICTED: KRAB-A domain-containing protein 2-like [Diuraphis noxia]|uniref:KRAB-A domain-containing protein 2-like n=1 Tax=Diuraphis noxia TaxID=143948 RepID=UPI000763A22F|nr:PREDICTED: KRAB-A domain-containing protein 2-like [Diuraphis noxia]
MEWQTRARFNEIWQIIVASKRPGNKASLTYCEYQERLNRVQWLKEESEVGEVFLTAKDQRLLIKYDVINVGGRDWLVQPQEDDVSTKHLLYVTNDELFDVLHEAHLETNHGTEQQMINQIRLKYCNVTREAVMTYLELCPHCFNPRQDLQMLEESAIPPIVAPMPPFPNCVYGKSVYFGMIDMQRCARDGYSYILVHWDVGTRLIHILPLQSMSYVHVAIGLMEIYSSFGMPDFLDAPYDMPYIISVVNYIKSVWHSGVSINLRTEDDPNALNSGANLVFSIMEPWLGDERFIRNWPSEIKHTQFMMNNMTYSGKNLSATTLYLCCQ